MILRAWEIFFVYFVQYILLLLPSSSDLLIPNKNGGHQQSPEKGRRSKRGYHSKKLVIEHIKHQSFMEWIGT